MAMMAMLAVSYYGNEVCIPRDKHPDPGVNVPATEHNACVRNLVVPEHVHLLQLDLAELVKAGRCHRTRRTEHIGISPPLWPP